MSIGLDVVALHTHIFMYIHMYICVFNT